MKQSNQSQGFSAKCNWEHFWEHGCCSAQRAQRCATAELQGEWKPCRDNPFQLGWTSICHLNMEMERRAAFGHLPASEFRTPPWESCPGCVCPLSWAISWTSPICSKDLVSNSPVADMSSVQNPLFGWFYSSGDSTSLHIYILEIIIIIIIIVIIVIIVIIQ